MVSIRPGSAARFFAVANWSRPGLCSECRVELTNTDPIIALYVRPKCHLCSAVAEVLTDAGLSFEEVDISRDPALEREFGIFVPVVQVNGRSVFEAGMDPNSLPQLLQDDFRT